MSSGRRPIEHGAWPGLRAPGETWGEYQARRQREQAIERAAFEAWREALTIICRAGVAASTEMCDKYLSLDSREPFLEDARALEGGAPEGGDEA